MTNIIRAEFLKSKRTMSSKLIVVFPIITLVMAFVLTLGMTNATQRAHGTGGMYFFFLV